MYQKQILMEKLKEATASVLPISLIVMAISFVLVPVDAGLMLSFVIATAMLILGSEEGGMRSSMEKRCDFLIRIPMLRDFDSLNVAQAGGIIVSWLAHHAGRKAGRSSSE